MSEMPDRLVHAIGHAREGLTRDAAFDLGLGYRHAIWAAFGKERGPGTPGWRRRVALALESAKKVEPLWRSAAPQPGLPATITGLAESALRSSAGNLVKWDQFNEFEAQVENATFNRPDLYAVKAAGVAALQALRVAFQDEVFDPNSQDDATSDADVEAEDLDAAFCAATAYAGGTRWDQGASSERRFEFWDWWLREAVPRAWRAAP